MFSHEATHQRSHFYVGGNYINTSSGHILQNQVYVEQLTPHNGPTKPFPIVFIHGGAQTGTNWLNKQDEGRGWASWFLERGYEIYIIDQANTGRSPYYPGSNFTLTALSAEYIEQRFTNIQDNARWPQAHLHTQWPGSGKMGDPIFDNYFSSTVQYLASSTQEETVMRVAGIALLDRIGPVILVAHSQGGLHGWSWTDARPNLVKALIQIEPKGPPFREAIFSSNLTRPWGLTSIPLTYSPPPSNLNVPLVTETIPATSSDEVDCILQREPARQLSNLRDVPILIETGEASYHATYDYCFVKFLKQAGCRKVEHMKLAELGIHGNGHLQFLEKNSDEIANALEKWISKTVST
ncbi:Alpha/Beta hydrolase protein [Tricladium varicosporioides]|nr:Alpha/Beta hydrolase protein [Hymenoscyphus varicosporioides]